MVKMEDIELFFIKRDILRNFGFLFNKGYKFSEHKKLPMDDWMIILKSPNYSIVFFSERGEFDLGFIPKGFDMANMIGFGGLIYFLSKGKVFIDRDDKSGSNKRNKQFKKISSLLQNYYDQITPYFGSDFNLYKSELITAGRNYSHIFIEKYFSK